MGATQLKNNKAIAGKILLVEDEPILQFIHKRFLENAGFKVDIADTGKNAVKLANTNGYKLIFMDIELPDFNGIEATAKIRKHENATKHVPIVALTTRDLKEIKSQCLHAGMDALANKPISQDKLCNLISTYTDQ